jgi:hypothetical protein
MNTLAKSIQDDDLRFSTGLLLSGLKLHKFDHIQVDCQKRINRAGTRCSSQLEEGAGRQEPISFSESGQTRPADHYG